ncbi:hypothetical protein SAMN05443144_10927 [Fodinibius roseus]|uniref:CsbD-like n=1 Tax=Fodinibius roseus TaxID=1194090 RepID=A0A1M5BYE0_9BACT|nr:general stress protein CsbD [Fodinibius roseus]SHF47426.1 hypothetical protein SAMN05443144_10927 [Fodinibius roseus]
MNKLNLYQNWKEKKKKLQTRYEELTDDDLTYVIGEEDELIDRIHRRLGTSREETRNMLRKI